MTLNQQLARANKQIKYLEEQLRVLRVEYVDVHPPICWVDACSMDVWSTREEALGCARNQTVGWVYHETSEMIALASSRSFVAGEPTRFSGIMVIPKVCIIGE